MDPYRPHLSVFASVRTCSTFESSRIRREAWGSNQPLQIGALEVLWLVCEVVLVETKALRMDT